MKLNHRLLICRRFATLIAALVLGFQAHAGGIYDNGIGARSQAMGGADVAWAVDPLGAMGVNPAGLGFLATPKLTLGAAGGFLNGHFDKPGVSSGNLDGSPGALPEGAFAMPLGKLPIVMGLSFIPESMLKADWHFNDPPGGLGGVSYGNQQERSEIITLRSALGVAGQITPELSMGASVGLIYNKNELHSPYIFQNLQPSAGLDGAKTLLDLKTEGLAWNAQVGVIWRATPDLQFGVSYESPSKVVSTGDATGDPSTQFALPQGTLPFHYDVTATNSFPQEVRAGVSWKFQPQWRLAAQLDWIDWSDAFDHLPLSFRNGNNPTVNGALGQSFNESIPLQWDDEFAYRIGLEYEVTPNLAVRAGYCYGSNPVPNSTLTPLTAAIMEHTLTTGVGYHWKQYSVDVSYQYYFPATQEIGTSGLKSGEFSNSSIEVTAHQFSLTTSVEF